jgi:hypothetical protein
VSACLTYNASWAQQHQQQQQSLGQSQGLLLLLRYQI